MEILICSSTCLLKPARWELTALELSSIKPPASVIRKSSYKFNFHGFYMCICVESWRNLEGTVINYHQDKQTTAVAALIFGLIFRLATSCSVPGDSTVQPPP